MIFPIERVSGHQIFNRFKAQSFFYELNGIDLEQLSAIEISSLASRMNIALSNISQDDFIKIYYKQEKTYLNSSLRTKDFLGLELCVSNDPIEVFFGDVEIYSDIFIGDDYLKVNGSYLRLISLSDFPNEGYFGELASLGDYFLFLKKQDLVKSKLRLERLRRLHLPAFSGSMAKHEGQIAYNEIDGLLRGVNLGEECLVDVICTLPVAAESLEDLNMKTKSLVKELKNGGYSVIIESSGLRQIYYNCIPGVDPFESRRFFPKRVHEVPSSFAITLIPIQTDKLYPKGHKFYSKSGDSVYFEIFSEGIDNYNLVVSGATGKGKSFVVNKIVFEEVSLGRKVVVLDKGKSFERSVKFHGGRVFRSTINPLQFKNSRFLKEFIVSFLPESEFGAKKQGQLYYFLESTNLDEFESFMQLIDEISLEIEDISPYFEEIKECFDRDSFTGPDITYVELENFPKKFRSGLIIFLIEYFKQLEGKKIFVFDECWDLLRSNAEYIEECFRTFRKLDASAVAITQSVEDLNCFGELGPVILNNSYHKILLEQILSPKAPFDEFDVDQVRKIKTKKGIYSEMYYRSDLLRKPIRYYPSDLEYTLFNTEKEEQDNLDKFIEANEQYFGFCESAKKWTRLKNA